MSIRSTALVVGGGGGGTRRCSFCGRREEAVEHLVRVRTAYICERCVAQAQEAIAAAAPGERLLRIRPARGQVDDRDAAELAIERAYETVFGADGYSPDERARSIERGQNLVATMEEVRSRSPARSVDVSVDFIRFVSDDEAEVQFALLLSDFGSPMPQAGHAVMVDGEWKVARETWCRLLRMVGVECPPPED
jgi:ClpX C4-type zinc finger